MAKGKLAPPYAKGIKPGSPADKRAEQRLGIKPGSAADKRMERGGKAGGK